MDPSAWRSVVRRARVGVRVRTSVTKRTYLMQIHGYPFQQFGSG
jgi:hypothetical protein